MPLEGVDKLAEALATVIAGGGPQVAIAAGVVVGLVLAVIVFARLTGLVAGSRADVQGSELQSRLLAALELSAQTEKMLRERLDLLQVENGSLHDEVVELRAGIALLRGQRRKLIEIMREIKANRLGPAAVHAAAFELTA